MKPVCRSRPCAVRGKSQRWQLAPEKTGLPELSLPGGSGWKWKGGWEGLKELLGSHGVVLCKLSGLVCKFDIYRLMQEVDEERVGCLLNT